MKIHYVVFSLLLLLSNTHYSCAMEAFSQSDNKGEYEERDAQYDVDSIELHGLSEEDKAIFSICYSPNNKYFASGAEDGTIKIWDATTRKLVKIIKEAEAVQSVCFSPDSRSLAAGLEYGGVLVYDMDKNSYTTIVNDKSAISVCFSNDNKVLIVGRSSGNISLYDAKGAREHGEWLEIYSLEHGDECVMEVCCSPDSEFFASCSDDGDIKVWNLPKRSLMYVLKGHTKPVSSICFSPDGEKLVSGSEDKTVKIWDWEKSTCSHTLNEQGEVSSVKYSPDGVFIAVSFEKKTTILDSMTMEEVQSFSHRYPVNQLNWRADGMRLLAGLDYGIIDIRNTTEVTILENVAKMFVECKDVSTQKDLLLNALIPILSPALQQIIKINLPSSTLWNYPQPQ